MIDVKQFCFLNLGRENRLGLRFRSMILRDLKVVFNVPDVEACYSELHCIEGLVHDLHSYPSYPIQYLHSLS